MINQQNETNYIWIPARVSPEVYSQIDSVAKERGLRRYQVIAATLKAGLSLTPYQVATDKILSERAVAKV